MSRIEHARCSIGNTRFIAALLATFVLAAGCGPEGDDPQGGAAAGSGSGANGSSSSGVGGEGADAVGGGAVGGGGGAGAGGAAAQACTGDGPLIGLPYPNHHVDHLKGVQPDFWNNKQELIDHHVGLVAMNLVWANWEPSVKSPPCNSSEQEYDGRCYQIHSAVDSAIKAWSDLGVKVTAIVYGVPAWARIDSGCSPIKPGFEIFCTPKDATEYGRFAGMLASRYDGQNGHGRMADFVIHNEVNTNEWFDIGCGQGVPCDTSSWIQTYADNYNDAYDRIRQHQSEARVLLSFTHHFDTHWDRPNNAEFASLSVKTFLTQFDALAGARRWQVAYHPYAPSLLDHEFSPDDLPRVTYGNIGVLLGWLRSAFPNNPCAWQVQLTESGVNSTSPSSEALQGPAICDGFRNIIGTPGINDYIYHRLQDHTSEAPLMLGLRRTDGSAKPAWGTWAWANHTDAAHPTKSCGFEHLPYTRLTSNHGGWAGITRSSSRVPPDDFVQDAAWYLARDAEPGTKRLFECLVEDAVVGDHTFISEDISCAGDINMGPVGHIWTSQVADTVALYQCSRQVLIAIDHYLTSDATCGGAGDGVLLGFARSQP